LPGLWSGLGAGANYTLVASQTNQSGGSTSSCGLPGLSKNSFNVNGFYEKYGIQARLAYNWRSSYLIVCNGYQGAPETQNAYGQLDFSTSYEFNSGLQVYFQGANILGATQNAYSTITERFIKLDDTGARYLAGLRFKI
jgi:TonB-dependent receptor